MVGTKTVKKAQHRTIAENVRLARTEAGLSRVALARISGVSRDYIREIEGETANVSIDKLCELASALGKKPADLLVPPQAKK